jgi:hypothetical protein
MDRLVGSIGHKRVGNVAEGNGVFVPTEVFDFDLFTCDFALGLVQLPCSHEGILGRQKRARKQARD